MAKAQLRTLFTELLRAYPAFEVSEPRHIEGNFVNGIAAMPLRLGARAT